MSRRTKQEKKDKTPKPRKLISMPKVWVQGFYERKARILDYINSGRTARGIPEGYAFDEVTGAFVPALEPQKGD